MAYEIERGAYAAMFGPTTGDKVRLADTDLIIEVEEDHTIYGEEVKFGGKVIRDGMGQSQVSRADGAVDTVITNALIVDHWGIVKADIGLKNGKIAAIGKAGILMSSPVSISLSALAPKLLPVKVVSSRQGESMHIFTGSVHNK